MPTDERHPASPDPEKMARGVRLFLEGLGLDLNHVDLSQTPERVTEAWLHDLADGYQATAATALGELIPAESQEPIFALGLRFVSLCPHHLLPFEGRAHLVYIPQDSIIGLGRLSKVVDAYAHRLVLQENLTTHITDALMAHLGAQGAGCVLVARHGCMAHRGVRQDGAHIVTSAWAGALEGRPDLQSVLYGQISGAAKAQP